MGDGKRARVVRERMRRVHGTIRCAWSPMGLMAFDKHALRYRGGMELAWSGCENDETASDTGHTTKAMIKKYAGEARQIMRARQAAANRI